MSTTIQVSPTRRIKIEQDDDVQNPRTAWEKPLDTMCCRRNRHFSLDVNEGDLQPWLVREFKFRAPKKVETDAEYEAALVEHIEKTHIVLPLYAYVHSGTVFNHSGFDCRWDSVQTGYHYIPKATIRKEWKECRTNEACKKKGEAWMRSALEEWNNYISGNCWGYVIENLVDGEWVEEHSCWGFIGDPNVNGLADSFSGEDLAAFRKEFPEPKAEKSA